MLKEIRCVRWQDGVLHLLDQTLLPHREEWLACERVEDVARAISEMRVRGAPAIGIVAAYGVALAVTRAEYEDTADLLAYVERVGRLLRGTRPTAVNLTWAIQRMRARAEASLNLDIEEAVAALVREAQAIAEEDEAANRRLSELGQSLLPQKASILTHCNAGALATGGYGTAVGVIRAAWEADKDVHVYVDETRPFLQGARLTTWELQQLSIPFTLITDNMAGYFLQQGKIDAVIVGADRISAKGDLANKIGTYTLAVLAFAQRIPFYCAAPISTLDLSLSDGSQIPIEERDPAEVTHVFGAAIAPEGTKAANPAFDITPNRYLTAIITERGIARPPYEESLRRLAEED